LAPRDESPPITPVPLADASGQVPPTLRRILVLGGSFDPPHHGHVQLPLVVRQAIERAAGAPASVHLLIVPAARSPHKLAGPAASDDDRLTMLALATQHLPRVSVWTDELDRAQLDRAQPREPSYTIDTLERMKAWLGSPDAPAFPLGPPSISLLIGADQALAFHRWKAARELLGRFAPVVMLRSEPGQPGAATQRELLHALARVTGPEGSAAWDDDDLARWANAIVPVGAIDVSSTRLRAALIEGDDALLARMLDPLVLKHIRERGLYRP
jgi:nicotinate-nucleotide adenylyltransferase